MTKWRVHIMLGGGLSARLHAMFRPSSSRYGKASEPSRFNVATSLIAVMALMFGALVAPPSLLGTQLASATSNGVTPLWPTCSLAQQQTQGSSPQGFTTCAPGPASSGAVLTGPGVVTAMLTSSGTNAVTCKAFEISVPSGWCVAPFTLTLQLPAAGANQVINVNPFSAFVIGDPVKNAPGRFGEEIAYDTVNTLGTTGMVPPACGQRYPSLMVVLGASCRPGTVSSNPLGILSSAKGAYFTVAYCIDGYITTPFNGTGTPVEPTHWAACTQVQIAPAGPQTSTTTTTVPRSKGPLSISLETTPASINLPVDNTGKVAPRAVSVAVTFTNTSSKVTLYGVQLIDLAPEPQDKTQALKQLALAKDLLPVLIKSLAPGASTTRKFGLSVTGDGKYQWRALALYNNPSVPGGNSRAVGLGGPFEAKVAPLFFSSATMPDNIYKQNGAQFVRAGDPWYIKATIKNVSAYKTLCVSPIVPIFKGNAAGIGPHDITVAGVREDAPPYAGTLKPGDSATIEMYVDTSPSGSTRGQVTFDPQAAVLEQGATCTAATVGSMTPLAATDKTIPKGSDSELVRVDTSTPVPINRSGLEDLIYGVGAIPVGAVQALFDSAVALEAGVGNAVSLNSLYTALLNSYPPVAAAKGTISAANAAIATYQALLTATDVLGNYWKSATPAEKQSFASQVESVMRREGNDFYKAAVGTAGDAAKAWLDKVEAVYASGDDAQVFSLYGNAAGNVATQIAIQVALTEAGQAIVQKAPALTAAFEKLAGSSVTIAALRDMPPGKLLNFTEMQRLWGLSQEDLAAFSKISKEYDVLIGVRGRSPISVTNLEEGAVWKHENLKPKNVSPIDIQYLGFPAGDAGTVQFRTFSISEEQAITKRIHAAGLPPDELKVVLDRFDTRVAESKYLKTIQGYSKAGEINVGFNYADNGISRASTRRIRKFKLVESKLPDGGTIYTPYQENLNLYGLRKAGNLPQMCERALGSVLCKVTGDMDGVYITTTSGTAVAQDKLVAIYEALQKAGWQHPETLTWINNAGEFYFAAKEKILQGLQIGGEATIQFAPDGNQYSTYIDLAKSKLINSSNYVLDLVGGYTNLAKAA